MSQHAGTSTQAPNRILCVLSAEQQEEFRSELDQLGRSGAELVFQSAPELALDQISELGPAMAIVGTAVGNYEGLEFLAIVTKRYPTTSTKVVVLADRDDPFPPVIHFRHPTTGRSITEQTSFAELVQMVRDNFGNTPQVATAMPQPVHQVRTFALATASAGAASAIHPPPDRASPGLAAAAPVVSGRPGWQQLLERGVSVALARPYWLAAAIGITLAVSLGLWVMDDGATKKRPDEMPAHDGARPALPQAPAGSTTAKPQAKPGGEAQPAAAADVDPDSESPPDTVGKPELSQLTSLPLRFDQGAAHYDVTDEARLREVVQTIVAALRRDDSLRVEVGGHTSREGSATINKRLGQRRADAVRQFLVEQGVGADRIVMRNYATKKPATAAGKAAAREMNRRVTVRLVP